MTLTKIIELLAASALAGFGWRYPMQWLMAYLWGRFKSIPGSETVIGPDEQFQNGRFFADVLGIVERIAYVGSWLLGVPEFIAVVLALKAAPQLKEWTDQKTLGRAMFAVWMTGSLLSIIGAVAIAELVKAIIP